MGIYKILGSLLLSSKTKPTLVQTFHSKIKVAFKTIQVNHVTFFGILIVKSIWNSFIIWAVSHVQEKKDPRSKIRTSSFHDHMLFFP